MGISREDSIRCGRVRKVAVAVRGKIHWEYHERVNVGGEWRWIVRHPASSEAQALAIYSEYAAEGCGDPPKPPKPTKYQPGSAEKIDVMAQRAEAGYALHHPDDLWCGEDLTEYDMSARRTLAEIVSKVRR